MTDINMNESFIIFDQEIDQIINDQAFEEIQKEELTKYHEQKFNDSLKIEYYENPLFISQYLKSNDNDDKIILINKYCLGIEAIIIFIFLCTYHYIKQDVTYDGLYNFNLIILFQLDMLFGIITYIIYFFKLEKYYVCHRNNTLERYIYIFFNFAVFGVIYILCDYYKIIFILHILTQSPQIILWVLNIKIMKILIQNMCHYLRKIINVVAVSEITKILNIIIRRSLYTSRDKPDYVVKIIIRKEDIFPFIENFNYDLSLHFLLAFVIASLLQYFETDGATIYTIIFRNYYFKQLYIHDNTNYKKQVHKIIKNKEYSKILDPYFLNMMIRLYINSNIEKKISITKQVKLILHVITNNLTQIMILWSICSLTNCIIFGIIFNILFTINFDMSKSTIINIITNIVCMPLLLLLLPKDYLLSLFCLKIIVFMSQTNAVNEIINCLKKDINNKKTC
jgi:hypothetical protein